jgi:hypothetical protein
VPPGNQVPCADCGGTGRRRAWGRRGGWRSCDTCGGIGDVDGEVIAARLRERARRDRERAEEARNHWLPPIADGELAWLVDELGYESVEDGRTPGSVKRWRFRSEHTAIAIAITLDHRECDFRVHLSPVDEPYCPSLNDCLALHDLPRVDLRLPREPSRELVVAKLELASAALYHLVPWEVGGDWS